MIILEDEPDDFLLLMSAEKTFSAATVAGEGMKESLFLLESLSFPSLSLLLLSLLSLKLPTRLDETPKPTPPPPELDEEGIEVDNLNPPFTLPFPEEVVEIEVAGFSPETLSALSTNPARRTQARRRVYFPIPPLAPKANQWLSPYCHPSSSTCQFWKMDSSPVGSGSEDGSEEVGRVDAGIGRELEELELERVEDVVRGLLERLEDATGDGGSGVEAGLEMLEGETVDLRTFHSGSSHFHSVVRFMREFGSDFVGEGV